MASHNNHHSNRVSILIVDDHEVVRNGIRSYLETLTEFNVVGEAASGEEALKLVSEHIPDIVLLDLIMPGMDGYEVCSILKQDPELKDVPVLLLTGTFEVFEGAQSRRRAEDLLFRQEPREEGQAGEREHEDHHEEGEPAPLAGRGMDRERPTGPGARAKSVSMGPMGPSRGGARSRGNCARLAPSRGWGAPVC